MGRHSDSDEDRKKKKKSKHKSRSSSSDSITSRSSKPKKSKKSKHKKKSKSRSPSRRHKSKSPTRDRRRSRSRSVPKSYMIKSRSPSPYRSKRRSKSPSPYRSRRRSKSPSPYRSKRRSKSPSPYRSKRRSRSTSRSRTRRSKSRSPKRRSRSRSRDRSKRDRSRDRSRSREKKLDAWDKLKSVAAAKAEAAKAEKEDPCANIPGFDLMTTSQQSEARLQMALKAAAAAGEKLKEQGVLPQSTSTSFLDQERRAEAIESIESDAFTPMAFKSSRGQSGASVDNSHENAIFGLGDLTLTAMASSELRAKDTESLMHPNLYISSEDKMQNWIQKLTRMRKRKLEGSAMFY